MYIALGVWVHPKHMHVCKTVHAALLLSWSRFQRHTPLESNTIASKHFVSVGISLALGKGGILKGLHATTCFRPESNFTRDSSSTPSHYENIAEHPWMASMGQLCPIAPVPHLATTVVYLRALFKIIAGVWARVTSANYAVATVAIRRQRRQRAVKMRSCVKRMRSVYHKFCHIFRFLLS